jgi:O-antigen ligase
LVLCESEGAYLALFWSLLGALFYLKRPLRQVIAIVFIVILTLFVSLFVYPQFYHDNVPFSLGGVAARSHIYHATVAAVLDSPIVGYGINTYKYISAGQPPSGKHNFLFPHQIILEMLFSVGVVGTLLLSFSFILLLKKTINPFGRKHVISIFGFLALTYLIGKGMTDAKLFGFYFSGLISMSLGFFMGGCCDKNCHNE